MNSIIFMILSLLLGIYGVFHLKKFEAEKRGMGYIELSGIILSQSNYTPPRINSQPGTTGSFHQMVKFTLNGEEHETKVYVSGAPDPSDIGKKVDLLVNKNNPDDAQTGSFAQQKYTGMAVIAVSILGFLISGFLSYKRFYP